MIYLLDTVMNTVEIMMHHFNNPLLKCIKIKQSLIYYLSIKYNINEFRILEEMVMVKYFKKDMFIIYFIY